MERHLSVDYVAWHSARSAWWRSSSLNIRPVSTGCMTRLVRFLDLRVQEDERREYLRAVDAILRSGIILNGPEVEEFERQAAEYCNVSFAIGVGSGTAALYGALKCLHIGSGDEVIVPALS